MRAVLMKDLLTEWRGRERVIAILLFAALVVLVFHFALPGGATPRNAPWAPGLFWIASVFAAVLGFNRAFAVELTNDALSALALVPADRGQVFLGKAIANFVVLGVSQVVIAAVIGLLFSVDLIGVAIPLAGVVALGSAGLCALGTLFGAISVRTRFREVMLPLLMLPLQIPVIAGATAATTRLFEGEPVPFDAVQLLIVANGVYWIVAYLGFEYVLDE